MTMKSNTNLTPENAEKNGFEWIQDVIYDNQAPEEVMSEFKEYEELGYVLGQPASIQAEDVYQGLYKPTQKE